MFPGRFCSYVLAQKGQLWRTLKVRPMSSEERRDIQIFICFKTVLQSCPGPERSALAYHEGATNELMKSSMTSRFSVMPWS